MAVTYITSGDITDTVVSALTDAVTARLLLVENDVNDLAERRGIASTEIDSDPVPYILKKWCVSMVCRDICLDKMGVNNLEFPDSDKYKVKYEAYQKLVAEYESQITVEVLTGTVTGARNRTTGTGRIISG